MTDDGTWLAAILDYCDAWCSGSPQLDVLARAKSLPWLTGASSETTLAPLLVSHSGQSLSRLLRARWQDRAFEEARILTGSTDPHGAFLGWLHREYGVARARVLVNGDRCSFVDGEISSLPLQTEVLGDSSRGVLHAKFYWFEGSEGAGAVFGSANCSAAAWLVPPDRGGNTEILAIFDNPSPADFASTLDAFGSDALMPVVLRSDLAAPPESAPTGPRFPVAEIAWERNTGQARVIFLEPPPQEASVDIFMPNSPARLALHPTAAREWLGEAAMPSDLPGSRFVDLRIHLSTGETVHETHWIHDLAALRNASRGRKDAETVKNLGDSRSRSERQRILSELQRIALALINEPSEFLDPLLRPPPSRPDSKDQDEALRSVDPDDLLRSLDQLPTQGSSHAAQSLPGLSLLGVLRALFEFEADECSDESQFDETQPGTDIPGDGEGSVGADEPERPPTATPEQQGQELSEREKETLRRQLDQFLANFRSLGFAKSCTATQLQQAAAFPLAVGLQGLRGGWVGGHEIVGWARQVFDVLFREELPEEKHGLIQAVRNRYAAADKSSEFARIIGDGTLWVALLHALVKLPWATESERFERALAIRWVYRSQDLLRSTDSGRMRSLLSSFERRHDHAEFLSDARRVSEKLNTLEDHLGQVSSPLIGKQTAEGMVHHRGDLLWHPSPGWGVVLSEAPALIGGRVDAYLHLRAREARVVAAGFFLNVSKAAQTDEKLAGYLRGITEWSGSAEADNGAVSAESEPAS